MNELRNDRHLSVHDLRRRIAEGDIDTVVVAAFMTKCVSRQARSGVDGSRLADRPRTC